MYEPADDIVESANGQPHTGALCGALVLRVLHLLRLGLLRLQSPLILIRRAHKRNLKLQPRTPAL